MCGGGACSRCPPGVFLLGSLPVRQVTLLGVVVAVSNGPKFTRFAVDDGTGCLTCVLWKAAPSAASVADEEAEFASLPLELGELLRVQGRLTFYNDQLELVAACVNRVVDANEELLHWLSCTEVSRAT